MASNSKSIILHISIDYTDVKYAGVELNYPSLSMRVWTNRNIKVYYSMGFWHMDIYVDEYATQM